MEAGEVVYQGREGTGGAQIFNTRPRQSLADYVLRQQNAKAQNAYRNAMLQRQMDQFRDKQVKDWEMGAKFQKMSPFYAEPIQNDINEYMQKGRELLDQGANPNQARMETKDLRGIIDNRIARSQKADALFKTQKEALATQKNKDNNWVQNHLMRTIYPASANVDEADFDAGAGALQHPRATDFNKSVSLAVDNIKGQIAQAQIDPTIRNSGLGKYMIIDKGRARFGYTDEKGNMKAGITPELVQHVIDQYGEGPNNELLKSVKWQMAKEAVEHHMGHQIDENEGEPEIRKMYELMNDPSLPETEKLDIQNDFKKRMYDKVERQLKQLQQQSDETSVHNLGQFPRAGGEGSTYDYSLVPGDGNNLSPFSEIKDNVTGFDNPTLPLPNLAKDVVFDQNQGAGDLSGFSTDENGTPQINWVDDYKQPMQPVPFNEENIAKIRNSIKNSKAGAATVAEFDKAVGKFKGALENKAKLELDGEKLDGATKDVQALYSGSKEKEPDVFRKELDKVLLKYGISDKSNLHRNIGIQWAGAVPKIKIGNGEWFDPAGEPEKLKEQLYDLNRRGFSKKAGTKSAPAVKKTETKSGKIKIPNVSPD